jgi:hypothetical protein
VIDAFLCLPWCFCLLRSAKAVLKRKADASGVVHVFPLLKGGRHNVIMEDDGYLFMEQDSQIEVVGGAHFTG